MWHLARSLILGIAFAGVLTGGLLKPCDCPDTTAPGLRGAAPQPACCPACREGGSRDVGAPGAPKGCRICKRATVVGVAPEGASTLPGPTHAGFAHALDLADTAAPRDGARPLTPRARGGPDAPSLLLDPAGLSRFLV